MGVYTKEKEIVLFEGHKNCNKIMKAFADLVKSADDKTFLDFNRNFWITKFNNTFVEMKLDNISMIIDCLKELDENSGIYTFDAAEMVEFKSLINAPKKDFEWVSVFRTPEKQLGISVSVKSKVSTNTFSTDLLFKPSLGINCGLPSSYTKLGFLTEALVNKMAKPSDDYINRYVIEGDELDDLNNGLIVVVKDKNINANIIRMMKNVFYRTIKSDKCIVDYVYSPNDNLAHCILSYESYTGSNPPIKITQMFSVYPYTENTDN